MMKASSRSRLALFGKSLLVLIIVLVALGILYEQIGRHRDRRRYPQIGHPSILAAGL